MPLNRSNLLNLLLVFLLAVFLSGLQTTFWFQIFGSLPAPLFWLNLVLYLILYRKSSEAILTIYALALVLNPFTAMPIGFLWLNLLIVFCIMNFIKKRVFWPGSRYFLLASLGMGFTYHLTYYMTSKWLDSNPATLNFFHRFFEILFTAIMAVPVYALLSWVDLKTQKETLPEGGGIEA